jgi:hypothetical protein
MKDARRINLLRLQPCGRMLWILVAVADAPTVSHIHRRFGNRIIVSGWLQPRSASKRAASIRSG